MSARIVISCNTMWQYGGCTTQLTTDADSIPEARQAARARGWRCNPSGDYCPGCSRSGPEPASSVVAILHPKRTP